MLETTTVIEDLEGDDLLSSEPTIRIAGNTVRAMASAGTTTSTGQSDEDKASNIGLSRSLRHLASVGTTTSTGQSDEDK